MQGFHQNKKATWISISLMLLIVLFSLVIMNSASASDAQKSGWFLVQRQAQLGLHQVYLTHDAIKIVNETVGYTVLASGPDWKVVICRPADHLQYVYPSMKAFLNGNMLGIVAENGTAKRTSFEKLGELKVSGLRVQKLRNVNKDEVVWVIPEIGLAPEVVTFANAWFQTYTHQYPYRKVDNFTRTEPVHGPIWTSGTIGETYSGKTAMFDTVSIAKRNFPASEFAYPKNFRTAKTPTEVLIAKNRASNFRQALETLESDYAKSK